MIKLMTQNQPRLLNHFQIKMNLNLMANMKFFKINHFVKFGKFKNQIKLLIFVISTLLLMLKHFMTQLKSQNIFLFEANFVNIFFF